MIIMTRKSKMSKHILGEPEELLEYLKSVVPKDIYIILEQRYWQYRNHHTITREELMLELLLALNYKSKRFNELVDMATKLKSLREVKVIETKS